MFGEEGIKKFFFFLGGGEFFQVVGFEKIFAW